ncbi:hypothetical protein OOT46_19945 [Aquabacterium sp. A7-Y]|uniref:hypothetical protein n=1 Tax=Aquabacterium sp. A7-Y TaxID=1349605 RepID=UPI00223CD232|nr:hypothetical protein [Aquabacterium sp. A7-Y]MCW7540111.1 hypothetical protein [Aquabacterium sp. A7-Y]
MVSPINAGGSAFVQAQIQPPSSSSSGNASASSAPTGHGQLGGEGALSGLPSRPAKLARTNSAPTLGADAAFYGTFRSVMSHGVLSQPEMRQHGIDFKASHDGSGRESSQIEVTRLPGRQPAEVQAQVAKNAVTNPYHGALTVALERSTALEARAPGEQEALAKMSESQRAQLNELPAEYRSMAIRTLGGDQVLTPAGQVEASRRMHSSFVVTADASAHSTSPSAHEQQRPPIRPGEMQQVLVPAEHGPAAQQALRDLRARGATELPSLQTVPSTTELSPQYQDKRGNAVSVEGLSAPAYHRPIAQQAAGRGDTDIHLVKTGTSEQDPARTAARPRSGSI